MNHLTPTNPLPPTQKIECCIELANDANTPNSNAQLAQTGVETMTKSGIFTEGYLCWACCPTVEKIWVNFKTHFNKEHTNWKNLSKMMAKEAGFGANSATAGDLSQGLAEAFDNLAMAAATNKTAFESLTTTTKTLQEELSRALEDNRRLLKIIKQGYSKSNRNNTNASNNSSSNETKGRRLTLDPNGNCWTHGFRVAIGHNGHTCTSPTDGHKKEAKRGSIMGGSKKGIPKDYKE
mmetsp:Transcript_12326/g.25252  ORF Transcript_12326/g.25252 Transcript_12326/m.25252 type:complete len:236 (+) Transcript_12326:655-1362(+)